MFVVAKVDIDYQYEDGRIAYYGLVKGKHYQIAKPEDIAPAPNNSDFIHVYQINGRVIRHLQEQFYTQEEWRQLQLNKIL